MEGRDYDLTSIIIGTRKGHRILSQEKRWLCRYWTFRIQIINIIAWTGGHSSWLQIRRPGFDSLHYQKKKVMGLESGSLSLVSTTEELLDRKVAAPVYKTENTAVGIRHADHVAPSIRKSWQSLRRQAAVARSV
jgi:hypothetical protein